MSGKEENLIPSELIGQENDGIENIECIDVDELFPQTEEVEENIMDPIFDNLRNLNICQECGIHTDCIVHYKENGELEYFCTEKCKILNSYKSTPRLIIQQLDEQPSTSSSAIKINDVASLYLRICYTCSAIIQINDYSNISWQAHDFCNEKCLRKHQVRYITYCIECKCSILDASKFGKYCMKFGKNIRTFCSKICLDKYKITLIMCQFCNNNIRMDAPHKYFAPITEHSSTFKQFCSINCVKNYCQYKLKLPYENEAENNANCFVCNTFKYVNVKFQQEDMVIYTFCSEICFSKYQNTNKIYVVQCCICKNLYEKVFFQKYCLYDGGVKNFCNENCQTTYYIIARKIVECNNCQVKKYNFDMIQKTFPNNHTIHACSFDCLKNSYKNMSRPIISSSSSQNQFERLYGNLKNLITLSMASSRANKANVSTICYSICSDASTSMDIINTEEKQTQTSQSLISEPTPLPDDHLPILIPIPVPIPVPIFIPTLCNAGNEFPMKRKKIGDEQPKSSNKRDLITPPNPENQENKPVVKRKLKKTTKKMVMKRDYYNFGLITLKRWIKKRNAQKNDAFGAEANSNLLKGNILKMTKDELHKCLITFLENMKRVHQPASIYTIFFDIQKYLLHNNKQEYIFLDASFKKFIEDFHEITIGFHYNYTLNSKLTEDYLWKTKQLGKHTPYTLLNSLIYFNCKLFGLKTLQEHLNLLSMQIKFSKKPILNEPGRKLEYIHHLKYSPETVSGEFAKNRPEINKQFYNRKRCPGYLYELYIKECPANSENCKSFYLKPEMNWKTDSLIWFSNQTLDEWSIEMMLNRIKMVKEINEL